MRMSPFGTSRRFAATPNFGRDQTKADIHCRCPVSFTTRAPGRRMILDPRLGAHVLCFELSDECSETRWERRRECIFVLELEAARPVRV
jgi:hypothetical protein